MGIGNNGPGTFTAGVTKAIAGRIVKPYNLFGTPVGNF